MAGFISKFATQNEQHISCKILLSWSNFTFTLVYKVLYFDTHFQNAV